MKRKFTIRTAPPELELGFMPELPHSVSMNTTVLCWLDLLGLRERLSAAKNGNTERSFVAEYLRVLRPIYRSIEWSFAGSDFHWNAFTDTIVLSARADAAHPEAIIGNITTAAAEIQFRLASCGWFLRGAMSYGDLWRSSKFVIGSALNNAYKLESEEAVWPRVILDESIRGTLPTFLSYYADHFESPQNQDFARDEDGQVFVNYLFTPVGQDYPRNATDRLLMIHKQRVEAALRVFNKPNRLRAKYLWPAAYHNWFCREWLTAKGRRALLIPNVPRRDFARLSARV